MKRSSFLTVGLIAISIGFLNAQTNQGKFIVGVSSTNSFLSSGPDILKLGYTTTKSKSDADGFEESEPDKSFSINFLPKVGYFVIDNLAIGLDLYVGLSTHKFGEDRDKISQTLLGVGPFVRYYIPTSKVLPFFELSGSFGMMNNKVDFSDNTNQEDYESKSSVTGFGGGIGLAVPLGEKVTFDVLAGYYTSTHKQKEDNEDNDRDVFGTLGLKLGFIVLLGSN